MRKILSILLAILLLCALASCDYIDDAKTLENVSELRNYYYVGNSDSYFVEMYGGKKETPLVIDGSAGKLNDYVKIKVLAKNSDIEDISYHIGINEEEFSGDMTKEIVGGRFVTTLKATDLDGDYTLKLTSNGKTEEIKLSSVTDDFIDYKKAREIAENELKDPISRFPDGYEVHIKVIEGEKGSFKYYWYVAFMDGESMCACLIDPITSKLIAKRT